MNAVGITAVMFTDSIGGWELILILAVVLLLFGAKKFPDIARGLGRGLDEGASDAERGVGGIYGAPAAEALTQDNQVAKIYKHRSLNEPEKPKLLNMDKLIVFLAQGFGVGRIPFAPGTFGSLLGLVWFVLLIKSDSLWVYFLGSFFGVLFAVWICGVAEKQLRQKDPPSVVLDEIVAIPICLAAAVVMFHLQLEHVNQMEQTHHAEMQAMRHFTQPSDVIEHVDPPRHRSVGKETLSHNWVGLLVFVGLFRLFDIWKPWPIRQSQASPGGWGIVMDDVLAALYVNLTILIIWSGDKIFFPS